MGNLGRKDIILEYGEDYRGQLFKAFVEPFVDVAKSAKLFSQDVLNSLKLAFDTLTTFSPRKLREARDKYKDRRDKLAREWEPLMKSARETLQGTDVGLVAMVVAPNLFFGAQALKLGAAAPKGIVDYLDSSGWRIPIISALAAVGGKGGDLEGRFEKWLDDQERAAARSAEERGRSGIVGRLRVFFFGEAAWHTGNLLSEAEGDGSGAPPGAVQLRDSLEEMVREFLEPALAPAREELLAAKSEQASVLVSAANAAIRGLQGLATAQDVEEIESAVGSMRSALGDSVDLEPVQKAVDELKRLMQERAQAVKDTQSPAPKGSEPGDVEAVATAAADQALKQASAKLREMAAAAAGDAVKGYREAIAAELMSDLPTKGPAAEALKGSETGRKLLELIKGAVDSVGK